MSLPTVKIVVPSHQRPERMTRLLRLLPEAYVTVNESEMEDYAPYVPEGQLVPHPDVGNGLIGIGHIRHWIMENFEADFICQCDDDVRRFYSMCHWQAEKGKYESPDVIKTLIYNAVNILDDLDLPLYGFSSNSSPRAYTNCRPFRINSWVGSCVIINRKLYGKDKNFAYDIGLKECEDGDLALQALQTYRVVLRDSRFNFDYGNSNGNKGGLQSERNKASLLASHKRMKNKWKGHWKMTLPENDDDELNNLKSIKVKRRAGANALSHERENR